MRLVIAEKPSVAQSIAKVLGADERKDGYMEGNGSIVSWCVGHLVELAQPDAYSDAWKKWTYDSLPMIPEHWQHEVKKDTVAQYRVLKELMHDTRVDSVVCATDVGREGELIFRLVYEQAGCSKPMKRLWISSMEESAIREGFENLKPGSDYDHLYHSALCRQEADWLVGINGTRLFTVLYGGKVLKMGRVQTPTLAMLVEREAKIMNFKKEQYFMAHILCGGVDAVTERIDSKTEAENVAGACLNGQALVMSVVKEEKTVAPPKLYDLTTLQRDANRLFGFTAKQTLEYTQSLYEKKLCTYPRTDSQYLSDDMEQTAGNVIKAIFSSILFEENMLFKGFLFLDKKDMPEVALHWEKHFEWALAKHNRIYKEQLPKITPHVCRHTYCSNMAKSGMNPKTLQYLMGHSDIGVTLNTYTHLGAEDAKEELGKYAKMA